jgi:aryl-alcohol dehydrogenase-like predicted oxidoreductase
LKNKIALGTVQFGMAYGVSNTSGQTNLNEVEEILTYAFSHGISTLDTAMAYGSSEEILGSTIHQCGDNWEIVTKTPHFKSAEITQKDLDTLKASLDNSREKLGKSSLYGLLVHACDDLFKPGGWRLISCMEKLKDQGLVNKVGVSLYCSGQIDKLLECCSIDLVQLPLNILDQRLIESGHLTKLKNKNIEIHARSAFLQGLLLMPLDKIDSWFSPIRNMLSGFHQAALDRDITVLQLALGFVSNIKEVDKVVVGVNNLDQLREIVAATDINIDVVDFKFLSVRDPAFINPSKWKLK